MKVYGLIFIFSLLSFQVFGKEISFSDSSENLGHIESIHAPQCEDQAFYRRIMSEATAYYETKKVYSAMARRQKALKLSNIKGFENILVKDFLPEDDYNTANALIMIKINKQVNEEDIILCRQKNEAKLPVYVVSYPYMDNYQVHILNLAQNAPSYEEISFIYP